jgi:predicted ATPase
VITGAPSSGKTSVIDELGRRGYHTEPEAARAVIEAWVKSGHTLEELRHKNAWLQNEIMTQKLAREREHDPQALIFMDRGIPDSLTYFRLGKMDQQPVREAAREFHYKHILIFDRLPFVEDGVRIESDDMARQMDLAFEEDYRSIGYEPVRIPVMPIPERTDYLLKIVGAL